MADQRQQPEQFDLDVSADLAREGLSIVGMDENNEPIVADADGKEFTLPRQAVYEKIYSEDPTLSQEGIKPEQIKLQLNSSSKPINQSPVELQDRAALSFGNVKGSINYLRKRFDDAKYDPEAGFVVNKGGAWHRVDANWLGRGDAWEKTKELVKDSADIIADVPSMVAQTVGATAVGTAAGVTAGVATAGAGALPAAMVATGMGAALGEAAVSPIKHTLGRALGTYEATPEEELADTALDALYAAGGQAVAPGIKPGLSALGKAMGNIADWGTAKTKDMFAAVAGSLSGIDASGMKTAIAKWPQVTNIIESTRSKLGLDASLESLTETVKTKKIEIVSRLLETAKTALPQKFAEHIDDLVQKAGAKGVVADFKQFALSSFQGAADEGLGYIETNKKGVITGFRFFTPEAAATRIRQGLPAQVLNKEQQEMLKPIIGVLREFSTSQPRLQKSASGSAKAMIEFERLLNSMTDSVFTGKDAVLERATTNLTKGWRAELRGTFAKAGLADDYARGAKLYEEFGGAVRRARKIVASDSTKGAEVLANQVVSGVGRNLAAKGELATLVKLTGKKGEALYNAFLTHHSAEQFINSKFGISVKSAIYSTGAIVGGAAGLAGPAIAMAATKIAAPIAGAVYAQSHRGVVAKQIATGTAVMGAGRAVKTQGLEYLRMGTSFLKQQSPEMLKELLGNEQAFGAFMGTLMGASAQEEQLKNIILQRTIEGANEPTDQ